MFDMRFCHLEFAFATAATGDVEADAGSESAADRSILGIDLRRTSVPGERNEIPMGVSRGVSAGVRAK